MKLFEDKVYKEMDWLEAACQPIKDDINSKLESLPDRVELTLSDFIKYGRPYGVNVDDMFHSHEEFACISYSDRRLFSKCFQFEQVGNPVIDTEKDTMTGGSVYLVKIKEMFEEDEIQSRLGSESVRDIENINYRRVLVPELNELLELLGLEEARKSRSKRFKVGAMKEEMAKIFKENRWMIKDMRLSNVIGVWIKAYVCDGNLAALSNFCKLKVMTHAGQPIYSITGEEKI